ncbi:MAG: hypothetical protein ABL949_10270 [Fimbriimonadaceae bacterium]
MRRLLILSLSAVPLSVFAQSELFGESSFTSQRGLSGLSGGGFSINIDGRFDKRGATALSTPIGFTLGSKQFYGGVSILSGTLSPKFPDFRKDVARNSNGTGTIMGGYSAPFGDFCFGGIITTGDLDSSLNIQFAPKGQKGKSRFAVGVQDVFATAAEHNGAIQKTLGGGNSRSPYAVVTTEIAPSTFATVGAGLKRFKGVFGSLTMPLGPVQGFVEYDTFNINFGITTQIYRKSFNLDTREQSAWSSIGVVRGKYFYWSLGIAF